MPSASQFKAFNHLLATLVDGAGSEDFPAQLIESLRVLVPAEDATILHYRQGQLPAVEHFEEPAESGKSTLDRFIAGAFLLDPFYRSAVDGSFGLFRLRDLAPRGFRDSEYYRKWYRNCGYVDEVGYLVELGEDSFLNIALGRTSARSSFSQAHRRMLLDVQPVVESLCRRHWQGEPDTSAGETLRTNLHLALRDFGESVLTRRESEVIKLILHGHSTRTVAERLGISAETVKLHRKHAYAKLEVSSQAELFYLFLDSLMSAREYAGGDPLITYLGSRD